MKNGVNKARSPGPRGGCSFFFFSKLSITKCEIRKLRFITDEGNTSREVITGRQGSVTWRDRTEKGYTDLTRGDYRAYCFAVGEGRGGTTKLLYDLARFMTLLNRGPARAVIKRLTVKLFFKTRPCRITRGLIFWFIGTGKSMPGSLTWGLGSRMMWQRNVLSQVFF